MLIDHLETTQEFVQWLETYDDSHVVGTACHPSSCPIAKYLKSTVNIEADKDVSVGLEKIMIHNRSNYDIEVSEATPYWVQQFILRVDDKYRANPTLDNQKKIVTVEDCKSVLRRINVIA